MNTIDPDSWAWSDRISRELASRFLDAGRREELKSWAECGEWFCAQECARLLVAEERVPEALEVLAPYLARGNQSAVEAVAEVLEAGGRAEEAIALVRRHAKSGDRLTLAPLARLLARHGRGDEALALLRPRITDYVLAEPFVDIAWTTGREEEAVELLVRQIEIAPRTGCCGLSCEHHSPEPFNAISLLATIRERQGRVEEAIALLHTRDCASVNGRDQLADLLARLGRIEELRDYAVSGYREEAVQCLVELLEERGDVEGLVAFSRGTEEGSYARDLAAAHLAALLARQGRHGEAIEILRAAADAPDGAAKWIVAQLCRLYGHQGRLEEGLVLLDTVRSSWEDAEEEIFWYRLELLAACGRIDDAVEEVRRHPEADRRYAVTRLALLLAEAGRTEQAVAVLEQGAPDLLGWRAGYLLDLGRIEEAVAVFG
ncbi:tetratricopeptide repeat protein [Kitasatospora sp. NPDC101183]|uniref:tetratricopeptide repeat protein n=1 Tax=Kitasatospora sp. NPDC101183 TaxID=3364100 RepID=UPI003825760A